MLALASAEIPGPGVGDAEPDLVLARLDFDGDGAAAGGELDRVAEQVSEGLLDAIRVARDAQASGFVRGGDRELDALLRSKRRKMVDCLVQDIVRRRFPERDREVTASMLAASRK